MRALRRLLAELYPEMTASNLCCSQLHSVAERRRRHTSTQKGARFSGVFCWKHPQFAPEMTEVAESAPGQADAGVRKMLPLTPGFASALNVVSYQTYRISAQRRRRRGSPL